MSTGIAVMAAILAFGVAPGKAQSANARRQWAMLSPFTAVMPSTNSANVRFDNHDYELISVNDQSAGRILEFCRQTYRSWWEKRFTEDLVEVLADMGHPMAKDNTVKLVLKDSRTGHLMTVDHAAMTPENRTAAYLHRRQNLKDHPDWPR
jgi:hypothetical protein